MNFRSFLLSTIRILTVSASLAAHSATLPLPEMVVRRSVHAPVIDGEMKSGEWDFASACTGFVAPFTGVFAGIQSTAWITFDDTYLYVAFRNHRAEQLKFLAVNGRRPDDNGIVLDPANEFWMTPPAVPEATYQTVVNAYPAILDVKMIPSLGNTSKAWSGHWEVASSQTVDGWTIEARAPLKAFGADKLAEGETWRGLFATDILADGDKFRAWAPGGAFADISRHGYLHFTSSLPAFQLLDVESISSGKPALSFAVNGQTASSGMVKVVARFASRTENEPGDIVLTKLIPAGSTGRQSFVLATDLLAAQLRTGFCEITASAGDKILYHQIFPFTVNGYVRKPPAQFTTNPYDQAFGLTASWAPLSKQLLVKIDRHFMTRPSSVAGGHVRLTDPVTGKIIAERTIAGFREDYSEFPVNLKELQTPVATEQSWLLANPRLTPQRPPRSSETPVPGPGEYLVQATLAGSDGKEIAAASTTVKLMGYEFPWLPNQIGFSDLAIVPWTPMQWDRDSVILWNKKYKMGAAGLAESLTNSGIPQLSGTMRLEAVVDGKAAVLTGTSGPPVHRSDAAMEFTGEGKVGSLRVQTNSRIEFDGFVWNTMTVAPTSANVSRLSLVVDMPEAEAPFFVTTSGGWSSYHGATPDRWDSRASSLTSIAANFVPYVFLTDSERGFAWFADNTQGWRLDPSLATQELRHHDGVVTLRVNFIDKPGPVKEPLTLHYGWMVTPQKAQPKAWRAYLIGGQKYFPQATPVFWNDADWDVLYPYYSSPFPKDYTKSRTSLLGHLNKGVVPCVGNIAHSIARYRDYKGRSFDPLAADWGITPGDRSNGNIARSRGPNDFQLFHFDRWAKLSGLTCLYFDENYLEEDWNYLTGGAYLLPDDQVEPGYSYLGLREYNKRLRYMFSDNHKPMPNLWEHTTGGQVVYAWMPDVSMEGENVEPTDLTNDYMAALPASRLRSIGMGTNLGSAPFIMCQACRHGQGAISQVLAHQLVGWVLAHDVLPEQIPFWATLASELELWRDDVRFLPYWKRGLGIESRTEGFDVSAHVRPGSAILWVVNQNRENKSAVIRLDLARIGLDPNRQTIAYDAENGTHYDLSNGTLTVPVPLRMWRAVRLIQPRELAGDLTFSATFETEVAASEAWGGRYPLGAYLPAPVPGGRTGNGAPLDRPLSFLARHHVDSESGIVSFAIKLTGEHAVSIVNIAGLTLTAKGKLLTLTAPNGKQLGCVLLSGTDSLWHEFAVSWKRNNVQISDGGVMVLKALLPEMLRMPGMGHGSEIRDNQPSSEPASITFGPIAGAVLDDVRFYRPALTSPALSRITALPATARERLRIDSVTGSLSSGKL